MALLLGRPAHPLDGLGRLAARHQRLTEQAASLRLARLGAPPQHRLLAVTIAAWHRAAGQLADLRVYLYQAGLICLHVDALLDGRLEGTARPLVAHELVLRHALALDVPSPEQPHCPR